MVMVVVRIVSNRRSDGDGGGGDGEGDDRQGKVSSKTHLPLGVREGGRRCGGEGKSNEAKPTITDLRHLFSDSSASVNPESCGKARVERE